MKVVQKREQRLEMSLLASLLRKDVRTVRRWITRSPKLRRLLRAHRYGQHWRIDYPKRGGEFDAWLGQIRDAVAPFTRTPKRTGDFEKHVCARLGCGNEQRERDLEILRHAMMLKRVDVRRNASPHELDEFHAGLDGERSTNLPKNDLTEWESDLADCLFTSRMISNQFKCRVENALRYLPEFLKSQREEDQNYNAAAETRLKRHHEVRLLPVKSDAEIDADCARLAEIWPEARHWQRAKAQHKKDWQIQCLTEAAFELLREGKSLTGPNLAPLVFRNRIAQRCWKIHQLDLKLEAQGYDILRHEAAEKRGIRGISLREFRQRYTEKDIFAASARAVAELAAWARQARNKAAIYGQPADDTESTEKDETGAGLRNERGEPIGDATRRGKDFVPHRTALRVRREFEQSDEEFNTLPSNERAKIEAALGRSLEDYKKNPFKEDFAAA